MSGCLIIPDKETAKARRELFGNSEQLDTISRQEAIDELERGKDKKAKGTVGGFYNQIIDNDIEKLRRLPPAQPQRTGRWIKVNGKTAINCSACYHCSWSWSFEDTVKRFNFCPNCGADMRRNGDGNEQDRVSG